jgi:hypothetical protein
MLSSIGWLVITLSTCALFAQSPYTNDRDEATIERVKNLKVSSLDGNLPKVTLEFFLKYEGEGAPIQWRVIQCDELKRNPLTGHTRVPAICVEAELHLKEGRTASVAVSLGAAKTRTAGVPTIFRVTVTDQNGMIHEPARLSDLPMELHRPLPKSPRDLPFSAGEA